MPRHIQQVIALKGSNEYSEGRRDSCLLLTESPLEIALKSGSDCDSSESEGFTMCLPLMTDSESGESDESD